MCLFIEQLPEDTCLAKQIQEYLSSMHIASDAELQVYACALHFMVDSLQATFDNVSCKTLGI